MRDFRQFINSAEQRNTLTDRITVLFEEAERFSENIKSEISALDTGADQTQSQILAKMQILFGDYKTYINSAKDMHGQLRGLMNFISGNIMAKTLGDRSPTDSARYVEQLKSVDAILTHYMQNVNETGNRDVFTGDDAIEILGNRSLSANDSDQIAHIKMESEDGVDLYNVMSFTYLMR